MPKLFICSVSSSISAGRSDGATEHIRNAITPNRRDPAFHHNLGNILRERSELAQAMKCFEQALTLAPNSVDTLYNLGNTCQDLGDPERAIAYFERGLRLRPDAIELHNNLGTALHDLGRLDEAVRCFRRVLALRPDTISAARCARRGSSMRRKPATSVPSCSGPIASKAMSGSASCCATKAGSMLAVAQYERALTLAPDHPETLTNLTVALVDLDRAEEAIRHYERALAIKPTSAKTHSNLGVA